MTTTHVLAAIAFTLLALDYWRFYRLAWALQRQLDLADEQLAAKDQRIDLLVSERALLNGRCEVMQHAINHYIVSIPKANKTHARRQAAERCMN